MRRISEAKHMMTMINGGYIESVTLQYLECAFKLLPRLANCYETVNGWFKLVHYVYFI